MVAFPFLYRDDLVLGAMGESPELCINADRYMRHLHCTVPEGQGLFSSMPLQYIPIRVERRSAIAEVSLEPLLVALCSVWYNKDNQKEEFWCELSFFNPFCSTRVQSCFLFQVHSLHSRPISQFPEMFSWGCGVAWLISSLSTWILNHAVILTHCSSQQFFVAVMP